MQRVRIREDVEDIAFLGDDVAVVHFHSKLIVPEGAAPIYDEIRGMRVLVKRDGRWLFRVSCHIPHLKETRLTPEQFAERKEQYRPQLRDVMRAAESERRVADVDRAAEEAAIRDVIARREAALNERDVDAFVALHTEDIDFKESGAGVHVEGRDEVRRLAQGELEAVQNDLQSVTFVDDVSLLTPTLALVNVEVRQSAEQRQGRTHVLKGAYVLQKVEDGRWRFRLHDHTRVLEWMPPDFWWLLSRNLQQMPASRSSRILPDAGPPVTAVDRQAIRDIFDHHADAVVRGDANAAAAGYTLDAELKSASGVHHARGRPQILHVRELFAEQGLNLSMDAADIDSIDFIRPRIALVHLDSQPLASLPRTVGSWIVIKEDDGVWRVRLQNNSYVVSPDDSP